MPKGGAYLQDSTVLHCRLKCTSCVYMIVYSSFAFSTPSYHVHVQCLTCTVFDIIHTVVTGIVTLFLLVSFDFIENTLQYIIIAT